MTRQRRGLAAPADPVAWPAMLDRVHHLDCVVGMRLMPAGSADLVFADPPFNIGVEYDDYDDARAQGDYLEWCASWLDESLRILKPTGSLWVAVSEEAVCEMKVLAEGRYALVETAQRRHRAGQLARPGVHGHVPGAGHGQKPLRAHQRHHVIWYYTFGVNCARKLSRSKTHLLHFVKSLKDHRWDEMAVRVPSARQLVYADRRASPLGRLPDDTWILRPQDPGAGFGPGEDVMHASRVCGTFKEKRATPNQMPEQLLGRVVQLCTGPGDLVVDPFCGSGTTAAVARKLGRHFVTFETSAAYALQAGLRVDAAREGDMLDTPEPGPPPRQP
jgi:site-specific DNA-methyltransferase (adenine-specific)